MADVERNETFTQTDTNDASGYTRGSNCDAYTTGVGETAIVPKVASNGGTAGTTTYSISIPKATSNVEAISIVMDPLTALTTWSEYQALNLTFNLECVTADANVYIEDIAVCRLTSAGANRTVMGGVNLDATSGAINVGVNSYSVSLNSSTSGAADDLILIAVSLTNVAGHSSGDIQVKLSQNIVMNIVFTYEREGFFNRSATAAVAPKPDYSEYLLADFFEDEVTGYKTISTTDAADAFGSWTAIDNDCDVYSSVSGDRYWSPRRGDA